MVGVSALEALAFASRHTAQLALSPSFLLGAWMDAQRGEVFSALYQAGDRPRPRPKSTSPAVDRSGSGHARILGSASCACPAIFVFIGDGAMRYRDVIERHGSTCPNRGAGAARSRARSRNWRAAAALRGEAVGPACRPSALRPKVRRRAGAGQRAIMNEWTIESARGGPRPRCAARSATCVVHQSMDARHVPVGAQQFGRLAHLYSEDGDRAGCRFLFVLAGVRRAAHQQPGGSPGAAGARGWARRCSSTYCARVPGLARAAPRSRCAARTNAARRLYERLGFTLAGTRPAY